MQFLAVHRVEPLDPHASPLVEPGRAGEALRVYRRRSTALKPALSKSSRSNPSGALVAAKPPVLRLESICPFYLSGLSPLYRTAPATHANSVRISERCCGVRGAGPQAADRRQRSSTPSRLATKSRSSRSALMSLS